MKKSKKKSQTTFQLSDKIHEVDELIKEDFKTYKRNKIEYLNVASAFDIETTSYNGDSGKVGIMYAWVFGINGKCVIGRTWDEIIQLLQKVSKRYELSDTKRLIVYVHNLSFEFQFIRKYLKWSRVFANDERTPIYALCDLGVEFRCSYLLSGYSLDNLGKNLHNYPVRKMVGDLDYSLKRHAKTPLSSKEMKYILNDGLVVMSYIQEMMDTYGNITKLALTKTGFVRNYCKKCCFYSNTNHHKYDPQHSYYSKLMKSLVITSLDEWHDFRNAFQGGFTHADNITVGTTQNNVASYDFTSSYPYVMISEKYPMARGRLRKITSLNQLNEYIEDYCCIFTVAFKNIRSKITYEHYISYSKCLQISNPIIDNGRVVSASYLIMTITNVDYKIIRSCYEWDEIYIKKFRTYAKSYLPTPFVKSIVELYKKKTTLKDVEGEEINYQISKENLNSAYGMTVTNIVRDNFKYDDIVGWYKDIDDEATSIDKYNNDKKRFLFYLWGVFITAYARYNLWMGIHEYKQDYLYSDTDSLKVINYKDHIKFINDYNEMVKYKLKKACEFHHIPFSDVSPLNSKGSEKTIGVWSFEGVYDKFKTLRAKCYMYYMDNKIHITISGVHKTKGVRYLLWKYKTVDNIFDNFKDGLYFPSSYMYFDNDNDKAIQDTGTGKNTHTYIDDEKEGIITDYLGSSLYYKELSSVHLEGCDYNLSMALDFINYLLGVKERVI